MSHRQITIVLNIPNGDEAAEAALRTVLDVSEPYRSAMGLEDAITALEYFEHHSDIDPDLVEEARRHAEQVNKDANRRALAGKTA